MAKSPPQPGSEEARRLNRRLRFLVVLQWLGILIVVAFLISLWSTPSVIALIAIAIAAALGIAPQRRILRQVRDRAYPELAERQP